MGLQGLRRNCRILGLVKIIVLVTVLWIGFDSIMQGSMFCKKGMAKKQVVANPIQEQSTLNSIVDYLKVLVSSEGKLTEEEFKELNKTLTSISKLTRNLQEKHEEQVFTYTKVLDQKVPTTEYERTRKKVEEDVIDMWYYLRSNIKKLNEMLKSGKRITNTLNSLLEDTDQRTGSLMFNLKKLQQVDGMETWRQKESQELSDLVQRRLTYLQNPKDCSKTNKLVCDIDKNCGFGCQVHHVVYCFIVAYGTQRTLILRSKNWRYSREGWETMFKPISVNCIDEYGVSRANWSESNDAQVIYLPILDEVHPRPPYLPPFIPKDLSDRLIRLHSSPIVWWIGQFLKYLLRPQGSLSKFIKEAEKKVDFNLPVVGIHVRRTDKLWSEAAFHKLEEYMKHVEIFYKQLELKQTVQKRQVYIATDDPNLLEECWNKFPDYTFIGERDTAKVAAVTDTRYSPEALKGVVKDIYMLSKTDLLICTFSSQMGRLAYEIMQTNHPDASSSFRSLDDTHYYGEQGSPYQVVIYDHHPRTSEEIELKKGDIVIPRKNLWNGFSTGMSVRNNKSGVYPSYKVVDQIQVQDFPLYEEADDTNS